MVKFTSKTRVLDSEVITAYLERVLDLIVEAMINRQDKITINFSLKAYKENLVEETMNIIKSDGYQVRKIIDGSVVTYEISWGFGGLNELS